MIFLHERLLVATDSPHATEVLRAVVDLHSPVKPFADGPQLDCHGCTPSPMSRHRPGWPCETAKLIARELQVNLIIGYGEALGVRQ